MGKGFDLRTPCTDCPFREDITFYLHPERAEEISDAVQSGGTFSCHKTTHETGSGNPQFCAGVLIIMERNEEPNQMMRIGERIGLYDHTQLDMEAPVFDTLDDFVDRMYELDGMG